MCIYRNSVCILFTLTISILTEYFPKFGTNLPWQLLPQIWDKFTLNQAFCG